jgi:hypothetical protein
MKRKNKIELEEKNKKFKKEVDNILTKEVQKHAELIPDKKEKKIIIVILFINF